jgi:hypothetical protein
MPQEKALVILKGGALPHPPALHPFAELPAINWVYTHKYSLTLGIILLAHVSLVGLEGPQAILLTPVLILFLYFIGFILMQDKSRLARTMLPIGLCALVLSGTNILVGGTVYLTAALTGHAAFILLLIVFMLCRLFKENKVTLDMIMAGIIIYLLMAGLWAQFFSLVVLANPNAISVAAGGFGPHPYSTIYYFSVATLTTAGFGDIVPVSDMARILAAYESLVGQVYLVVFIALLMGRHFASK